MLDELNNDNVYVFSEYVDDDGKTTSKLLSPQIFSPKSNETDTLYDNSTTRKLRIMFTGVDTPPILSEVQFRITQNGQIPDDVTRVVLETKDNEPIEVGGYLTRCK